MFLIHLDPHPADQTPPRRELRNSDPNVKGQSLYQLQLAPSSILHLMFRDESLNRSSPIPYPCTDLLLTASSDVNLRAPLAPEILELAKDLPAPPPLNSTPESSSPSQGLQQLRAGLSNLGKGVEKKLPKWLKIGPNATGR